MADRWKGESVQEMCSISMKMLNSHVLTLGSDDVAAEDSLFDLKTVKACFQISNRKGWSQIFCVANSCSCLCLPAHVFGRVSLFKREFTKLLQVVLLTVAVSTAQRNMAMCRQGQ